MLMAGPAVNLASILVVHKSMGRRFTSIYLICRSFRKLHIVSEISKIFDHKNNPTVFSNQTVGL